MNYYIDALKNYGTFTGRASRKQFWMFVLFNFLIAFGIAIIAGILVGVTKEPGFAQISNLYSILLLVPSLAIGARRLHDTGRSGWWQLIGIIPLVGFIVLIVFFVGPSQPGANQYGEEPGEPTEVTL